jgi:hypothetical protein
MPTMCVFSPLDFSVFSSERTPLHLASVECHVEVCKFLIASKAGIDAKDAKYDIYTSQYFHGMRGRHSPRHASPIAIIV